MHSTIIPRRQTSLRALTLTSVSLLSLGTLHRASAQDVPTTTSKPATAVQEVTVTAERRTQNIQKIPASVSVVRGADLLAQGRITTAQILETIPNVTVPPGAGATGGGDNPNGNISIRGVQSTQTSGGMASLPSATASYVDDIFQGIGGNFDIDRVEVLRGPQGTLYGRSATGGVVAFHTVDPVLGKYAGNISGEYGTADLRQVIVGANIPIGDQVAVRVSAREFDQNGYYNGTGGAVEDQEARVKVLYQPFADLKVMGGFTFDEHHNHTGGAVLSLTGADDYDFGGASDPIGSQESRYHQYWGTINYNFGLGNVTYIGAIHDYVANNLGSPQTARGQTLSNSYTYPLDQFHTEEVRIASNPGSKLTWLVGGFYYSNLFKNGQLSIQDAADIPGSNTPDTTPGVAGAPIFANNVEGRTFDYGVFTEDTYPILPNLRVTGGARFDYTKVESTSFYVFNFNLDQYENSLNPPSNSTFEAANTEKYENFTYKVRLEYDLTSRNLLYAMGSNGFLPGGQELSPQVQVDFVPTFHVTGATFKLLAFDQERLTAWEIGSKNRFFGNTLQVNGDVFYYDFAGKQESANTGSFGPPVFSVITVPVRQVGAELETIWRATPDDRLALNIGVTDAEITGYPNLGLPNPTPYYLALSKLPGVQRFQMTFQYDHTFEFANGATIVPRTQLRYTGAYDLAELSQPQVDEGARLYNHQGGVALLDFGLTFTAPSGKYSVTGYARNVADERYKTGVVIPSASVFGTTVTPGDPRTFGVVLAARF